MKTHELTGAALDYWVARAEGKTVVPDIVEIQDKLGNWTAYHPSSDWSKGGPIIEREKIDLMHVEHRPAMGGKPSEPWNASMQALSIDNPDWDSMSGTTALEAAMRAFVACHFGATVGDRTAANGAAGQKGGEA